ncbi:MAG TPA: zinc-dependent metalloprotease family protein [Flavobacteriaceae bacterium]|nr:zinc-dependent metalloprotease family protein [Flavobacteriaceae bacterium]
MKHKKTTIWLLMLLMFPILAFSQARNFWSSDVKEPSTDKILETYTKVSEYEVLGLNLENFKQYALQAPFRGNGVNSSISVELPNSSGGFNEFELFQTHTLSPGLAAKFPSISSYVGVSKDKKLHVRMTITNQGIYGMVMGGDGFEYINPMNRAGSIYQVFNRKDISRSMSMMQCMVSETVEPLPEVGPQNKPMVDDATLRTYELAVATTGEYATYHVNAAGMGSGTDAEKKAVVLAAITVTMDRVNGIYENAVALTMTLVPNNDLIIYLNGGTDPFTNNNAGALINESQTVINNVIGFSNYDIGHTFSTGAGGLAQLYAPCTGNKARGVTGTSAPVGDPYDIDYVAHEMGHQYGAPHTFNNSCSGNRNNATAVEPGSGSTIMAYAGICPPNIQSNSDPIFHAVSINAIYGNITTGPASNCPDMTAIANSAPVVAPIPDYNIPYGTAFVLSLNATDAENDTFMYSWDQTDTQIATMPPLTSATGGPIFRSFDASVSNTRYFPNLSSILSGNLAPTWEVIPNVPRTIHLTGTVWDNNVLGGQSTQEDVTISVKNTGPFVVTSQNEAGNVYAQNQLVTFTWDVAGTDANGINCANVDILLSYVAGTSFPEPIILNTPNDGSQTVRMPIGQASGICKLMIKGSDNIFFDVNDNFFTITSEIMSVDEFTAESFSIVPNPNNGAFSLQFGSDISGKVKADIYDIRGRLISSYDLDTSTGLTKTISMDRPQTGIYILQISNGSQKVAKKLIVN